jgi:lysophospholipase L1-like esterase
VAGATVAGPKVAGPTVAGPGPVWILGDSLTVGASPYLAGLLPGRSVSIDARVGRTTDQGIAIAAREAPTLPGKVMVALGTNDGASGPEFAQRIDQLMALLGTRRVLWVNVSRPGYQALNDALVSAVGRYPNLQVVDWRSAIAQHPEDVAGDGIHCTDAGYQFRAQVMAAALA